MRGTPDPIWVKLRELREAAGRTRRRLAAEAGVTDTAIKSCETGEAGGRLDTARRVAAALGHDLDLIAVSGPPPRFDPRRALRPDGVPTDAEILRRGREGRSVTPNHAEREWIVRHLAGKVPVREIAATVGVSARHVQRLLARPQGVDGTVDSEVTGAT